MRARSTAVVLLVSLLTLGLAVPATADSNDPGATKQRVDAAIGSLKASLQESSAQLQAAAAALKTAEAKLATAQAAQRKAAADLATAQAREQQLADQLDLAQREEAKASRALGRTETQVAQTRAQAAQFARDAYMTQGLSGVAAIISATSPDDVLRRTELERLVAQRQRTTLAQLAVDRARARVAQAQLEAKRAVAAQARAEQEAVVSRKQQAEQASRSAARQVLTLVAERKQAMDAIARERDADLRQYAQMQAESRRLGAVLRARAAGRARTGGPVVSDGNGAMLRPVDGPITSPYGMRVHPITHVYKLHDGTDFGAACGTPIHAAASGQVVSAQMRSGYGNQVVVDDGTMRGVSVATSYNHLSRFAVSPGENVARGQVVGYVGETGYATGCHLHFMVYVDGATVNPMGWL